MSSVLLQNSRSGSIPHRLAHSHWQTHIDRLQESTDCLQDNIHYFLLHTFQDCHQLVVRRMIAAGRSHPEPVPHRKYPEAGS